jgi:hypothetical protein
LELTALNRFVGASYGTQQQVNRHVEEAIVAYKREETARLAQTPPTHPFHQWSLKPTGFFRVKPPLGLAHFLP